MKNLFSLIVLALATFAFTANNVGERISVDTVKSIISWKGYKVTGEHSGVLKVKNGNLDFDGKTLTGGSFEIDMTSLTVTDLKAGQGKEKLEGHLKSGDFFGIEKFPIAKFEITKVVSRGTVGAYKIIGNLTIKETTQQIKFNTSIKESNGVKTATADLTIDRSEFDVRYGSGSFIDNLGDKTIYDEFDLSINLVLK